MKINKFFYVIILLLAFNTTSYGGVFRIWVSISGKGNVVETFGGGMSRDNRLFLARGETYHIKIAGDWMDYATKVELFTSSGPIATTMNITNNLPGFTTGKWTDDDDCAINFGVEHCRDYGSVEFDITIPAGANRGVFQAAISQWIGGDVIYLGVVKQPVFNRARFVGNHLPELHDGKVFIQLGKVFRLRLSADAGLNFSELNTDQSGIGTDIHVNNFTVGGNGSFVEMNISTDRTQDILTKDFTLLRVHDSKANGGFLPLFCLYKFSDPVTTQIEQNTVPTNLKDWIVGPGNSFLPDLVPAEIHLSTGLFVPASVDPVNALQDNANNLYFPLSAEYKSLADAVVDHFVTGSSWVPINIPGRGAGKLVTLAISSVGCEYGVTNKGFVGIQEIEVRILRFNHAEDRPTDNRGVLISSSTVASQNFPTTNSSVTFNFQRPTVHIYLFDSDPNRAFLQRVSRDIPNPDEETAYKVEVDFKNGPSNFQLAFTQHDWGQYFQQHHVGIVWPTSQGPGEFTTNGGKITESNEANNISFLPLN
jgi:hypothetical protein